MIHIVFGNYGFPLLAESHLATSARVISEQLTSADLYLITNLQIAINDLNREDKRIGRADNHRTIDIGNATNSYDWHSGCCVNFDSSAFLVVGKGNILTGKDWNVRGHREGVDNLTVVDIRADFAE